MGVEFLGFTKAQSKLTKLIHQSVPAGTKAALAGAYVFEALEKQKCPVGHQSQGVNLRSTIHSEPTGPCTAIVGPNSEHAMFVEFGTGLFSDYPGATPHRIFPVHASVLSFPVDVFLQGKGGSQGRMQIAVASTAGMKPHPFVRPSLAEGREPALRTTERVMLAELEKEAHGS